jgi:hypothetical protein
LSKKREKMAQTVTAIETIRYGGWRRPEQSAAHRGARAEAARQDLSKTCDLLPSPGIPRGKSGTTVSTAQFAISRTCLPASAKGWRRFLQNLQSTATGCNFAPQIVYDRFNRSIRDFHGVPAGLGPRLSTAIGARRRLGEDLPPSDVLP